MRKWSTLVLVFVCGCGASAANHHEASAQNEEACHEIASACHPADQGSGLAHECHANAHGRWNGDDCAAHRDECLAACGNASTE